MDGQGKAPAREFELNKEFEFSQFSEFEQVSDQSGTKSLNLLCIGNLNYYLNTS